MKELSITEKGTMILAKHGYPTKGSKVGDNAVFRLEHAKLDDKNFDLKVNFCPHVKTWKALGILDRVPDLCDLLTEGDNGVSIVFAPKLHMTLTKSMSKGDPYCIYSWKEKRTRARPRSWKSLLEETLTRFLDNNWQHEKPETSDAHSAEHPTKSSFHPTLCS